MFKWGKQINNQEFVNMEKYLPFFPGMADILYSIIMLTTGLHDAQSCTSLLKSILRSSSMPAVATTAAALKLNE